MPPLTIFQIKTQVTGYCLAQANPELIILLPLPPMFWHDDHAATMPGSYILINKHVSCIWVKVFYN